MKIIPKIKTTLALLNTSSGNLLTQDGGELDIPAGAVWLLEVTIFAKGRSGPPNDHNEFHHLKLRVRNTSSFDLTSVGGAISFSERGAGSLSVYPVGTNTVRLSVNNGSSGSHMSDWIAHVEIIEITG